jgi:hypothetical protein
MYDILQLIMKEYCCMRLFTTLLTHYIPMRLKWTFYLLVIGIILGVGLFAWYQHRNSHKFVIDTSRPSVVLQVRSLGRLETASYTIDKVIQAGTAQGTPLQDFLYGDRLLLIAHGTITAGVAVDTLQDKDVSVQGTSVTLNLPAPQIFSTNLDNAQTQVFDRRLGVLTKGDQSLETAARTQAISSITQAACDDGIMENAASGAKQRFTDLFRLLGFSQITVTVDTGQCALAQ